MNIAFLTTLNPYDINNWSGTTYHLLQTLSSRSLTIDFLE